MMETWAWWRQGLGSEYAALSSGVLFLAMPLLPFSVVTIIQYACVVVILLYYCLQTWPEQPSPETIACPSG